MQRHFCYSTLTVEAPIPAEGGEGEGRAEDLPADRVVVVLHETQNYVNIAGTIRAMKNFGLHRLRLVSPAEWDPWRIAGIAHDTHEIIDQTRLFETLDEALADCVYVAGFTARQRRAKRAVIRPRELAPDLLARASASTPERPVALLFGREDKGLPNEALDRCHRSVVIPTNPEHSSLNLAQAVLLAAYELWMSGGSPQPFKDPRRSAPDATREELETLFGEVEDTLWRIDFFKSRKPQGIMRTVRELAHRAELDGREAAFLRAVAIEVRKYLERTAPSADG